MPVICVNPTNEIEAEIINKLVCKPRFETFCLKQK